MRIRLGAVAFVGRDIQDLQERFASYRSGYERGRTWPEGWGHLPGGPFV